MCYNSGPPGVAVFPGDEEEAGYACEARFAGTRPGITEHVVYVAGCAVGHFGVRRGELTVGAVTTDLESHTLQRGSADQLSAVT
ncbi:hypothetical protein ON010_g13891 [Phytophthora cinnamomi]|nr:hypothetical protein ON010_g13891 [Phytophthora cinnamomi]